MYEGEMAIVMEGYLGLSSKCSTYAVSDDYWGASMINPMIPEKNTPTAINGAVRKKVSYSQT